MGQLESGLTILTEALPLVDTTGERWYETELYRLKGELLLIGNSANSARAAECFTGSIDCARAQGALSWELRTTVSLALLERSQDRTSRARRLLQGACERFTEGFDTSDVKRAKGLLQEWSSAPPPSPEAPARSDSPPVPRA